MSGELLRLRNDDGFTVEYDLLYKNDDGDFFPLNPRRIANLQRIAVLDQTIDETKNKIEALNEEIERLTNHADNFDYLLAVASGALTGLLDIFFVGELNLKKAKVNTHKQVNKFIEWYAESKGYKGKGRLEGAIAFLEKKYPVAQDNIWKGQGIGTSASNHHLDDLAHHPTIVGLLAAIVIQFLRCGVFVNRNGEWHLVLVDTTPSELAKIWSPIVISGILLWLANIASKECLENYGDEIPKPILNLVNLLASAPVVRELLMISSNWAGHLISDMGGSKNTAGGGMGIPGFFLSLLKEFSSVPPLNYTQLPQIVNDLYTKEKIDFRTETAFISELGRQAIPVMLNEIIVRSFYFVRRLIFELGDYKSFKEVDWDKVNWKNVIPLNNRTIARMMTIATGTFTAIDMADAAIRAAMKSGGNPAVFFGNFALRVNFVGVGRFVVAIGTDLYMGYKRSKFIAERMEAKTLLLVATNAKMFYYEANMWISAQEAGLALAKTYERMKRFAIYYAKTSEEFKKTGQSVDQELDYMEDKLGIYNKFLNN